MTDMKYVILGYRDRSARLQDFGNFDGAQWTQLILDNGFDDSSILERVELADDRVGFRTLDMHYLESDPAHDDFDGRVLKSAQPNDGLPSEAAEIFLEIWVSDHSVGLRTDHNTFLTAENDGKAGPIVSDRGVLGPWQQFVYMVPPEAMLQDALSRYRPAPPPPRKPPVSIHDQFHRSIDGAAQQRLNLKESAIHRAVFKTKP